MSTCTKIMHVLEFASRCEENVACMPPQSSKHAFSPLLALAPAKKRWLDKRGANDAGTKAVVDRSMQNANTICTVFPLCQRKRSARMLHRKFHRRLQALGTARSEK